MINAYSSAYSSMANGAADLYARQNLPPAAARSTAALAAHTATPSAGQAADPVSISAEAHALQQAERDATANLAAAARPTAAGAAALPAADRRLDAPAEAASRTPDPAENFAENGVPVDFTAWQASEREIAQRVDERVALYKKSEPEGASDDPLLRRIAAYDEQMAGRDIRPSNQPTAPAKVVG